MIHEEKLQETMRFYLLATRLKYKIRSGWDEKHWNVKKERLESVAEHVYGALIFLMGLHSEINLDVDLFKVLKMLTLHEIGEAIIPDYTPYDNITPEEKQEIEHQAMEEVLGDLARKEEYFSLLLEFDEQKTKEAILAFYIDKMEADIQCKVYQDMGCHHSFDFWYEVDKPLYKGDELFLAFLEYIKNHSTLI